MYHLDPPPKTIKIDDIFFGGQIGENPISIITSLFSEELDSLLVNNPLTGKFDRNIAEERVQEILELRDSIGLPILLDCLGHTVDANIRYMEFIAENVPGPFLLDAPSQDVRMPSFRHAMEIGLKDRIIFNSISHDVKSKDLQLLKEYGVQHVLVMAHNQENVFPEGRIALLEGDPKTGTPGLLQKALDTGAKNILIDTAMLGGPGIALANAALRLVKTKFGWPVGAGSANAPHSWEKMGSLNYTKEGYGAYTSFLLSTVYAGCDFILCGSVHHLEYVVPAIAIANSILGYYQSRMHKIKITHPKHPLKYYFKTH